MQSLGGWFATATVRKVSAPSQSTTICLFYQYSRPILNASDKDSLKAFLENITLVNQIGGRMRISEEGLNCTISGSYEGVRDFTSKLALFSRKDSPDDKPFADTHFKYIDDLNEDRSFKDLKILPVKELVFYGDDEITPANCDQYSCVSMCFLMPSV